MARIAILSPVFFLVVLLATACQAETVYRLLNQNNWAKNFPPGGSRPPFFTSVIVDDAFASVYERWVIERFEEGYTIKNLGTGFYLTARNGEAYGSSEFDSTNSKWYIESLGQGFFRISVPNQDLLVTALRKNSQYPISLYLESADGSPEQKWSFERL
ncbi:hypothetical protein FBU30_007248 [Linnemannia zychae]|nr:hypothetical protein FBU30_007248 [Linnemannia zychae]